MMGRMQVKFSSQYNSAVENYNFNINGLLHQILHLISKVLLLLEFFTFYYLEAFNHIYWLNSSALCSQCHKQNFKNRNSLIGLLLTNQCSVFQHSVSLKFVYDICYWSDVASLHACVCLFKSSLRLLDLRCVTSSLFLLLLFSRDQECCGRKQQKV